MNDNITTDDVNVLIEFLQNNNIFTQNKNVRKFEERWSEWLGVKYSVFVNSGSSANFITMASLAELYGKGEIIVPAITWSSDISSIILAGHKPVFVDVNKENLAMNDHKIIEAITSETKAVFLSHILGFNGLSDYLIAELKKRNILLIEDVCESHGATFHGKKCGTYGYASNFSFYFAHHMSTIEGGMICTNDRKLYEYARMFRSHGMVRESTDEELKQEYYRKYPDLNPEFIFTVPGYNMRSTELNAVIGLNQLKRLDDNNKRRCENFKFFMEKLDSEKYYTDFDLEGSVNYAFVLMLRNPDKELFQRVCKKLREEKVEFRRGTSGGGNQTRQPYLRQRFPELKPEEYINADFIHFYGMYIGNFPTLEKNTIEKLLKVLNEV
jgi:CDP-6-deoxy-D-xylo-4-hexulose-3-dehydrase